MTKILLFIALFSVGLAGLSSTQVATNSAVYGRDGVNAVLAKSTSLNFNQTNTDNAITINVAKYVVRRVTVTNCSTTFGGSLATLGVFTATGGGGTAVVSLGLLQSLTGSTKYVDMSLALTTDTLAVTPLYLRNGVSFGSAATCDVYVIGDVLP